VGRTRTPRSWHPEAVDGVLLLDKPSGITSNLALQQARRLLQAAKAGHTGTLDPLASGLLPLTFGEATKFSADLLEADKSYRATLRLGITTTTGDAEGAVRAERPVAVTAAQLDAVLSSLTGSITQMPPMHSALKKDGRPLYDYARAGIEVERTPRGVRIDRLERMALAGHEAVIDVDCSKGTYVRVLAEDIGARLGCGAHLGALVRTRVGGLSLDQAIGLAALEALPLGERRACLLAPDALIAALPRVDLAAPQARLFCRGQALDIGGAAGRKRVYGPDQRLLGVAETDSQGVLNPRRLIATPAAGGSSP
jgi:tRNA pseudouridine55 synthase